jgi:hypothetical protein
LYDRVDCGHVPASHPSCGEAPQATGSAHLDTHSNDAFAHKVPPRGTAQVRRETLQVAPMTEPRRTGQPGAQALRRPIHRPRLTDRIGFWRRLRSSVELVVVSVILGLLLAAILAAVVATIVVAIQNALNG